MIVAWDCRRAPRYVHWWHPRGQSVFQLFRDGAWKWRHYSSQLSMDLRPCFRNKLRGAGVTGESLFTHRRSNTLRSINTELDTWARLASPQRRRGRSQHCTEVLGRASYARWRIEAARRGCHACQHPSAMDSFLIALLVCGDSGKGRRRSSSSREKVLHHLTWLIPTSRRLAKMFERPFHFAETEAVTDGCLSGLRSSSESAKNTELLSDLADASLAWRSGPPAASNSSQETAHRPQEAIASYLVRSVVVRRPC